MKEELITFETARLAKEKGYLLPCVNWYNFSALLIKNAGDYRPANGKYPSYSAPTQSLLQKWLREKHKIYVSPRESWSFDNILEFVCTLNNTHVTHQISNKPVNRFETFEEAFEKGLQEALKLIK
ncbi:MAG: hypothetical protein IMZ64_07370 [Bacteroidetes bacterium]|nr:hypothetical protein [Bacteroidota bacterium]